MRRLIIRRWFWLFATHGVGLLWGCDQTGVPGFSLRCLPTESLKMPRALRRLVHLVLFCPLSKGLQVRMGSMVSVCFCAITESTRWIIVHGKIPGAHLRRWQLSPVHGAKCRESLKNEIIRGCSPTCQLSWFYPKVKWPAVHSFIVV